MLFALLCILAWGIWIAPAQGIPVKSPRTRTFYVGLANLGVASIAFFIQGSPLPTGAPFWLPFAGGVLWAVASYFAFLGTENIGMAKATGVWAPLNIIFSVLWGVFLFHELVGGGMPVLVKAGIALVLIIAGVLCIVCAGASKSDATTDPKPAQGWFGAIAAGVLWGSYFVPIRLYPNVSLWTAALPMALGIVAGGIGMLLLAREKPMLQKPSHGFRLIFSGLLWSAGSFTSFLAMEQLGTAPGFTLAQLNVLVAAGIGMLFFKNPSIKSKAGLVTVGGIILALVGGVLLGNLK